MNMAHWTGKAYRIIEIRQQFVALDNRPTSLAKDAEMISLMREESEIWASIDQYCLPAVCRLVFENLKAPKIVEPDLHNLLED